MWFIRRGPVILGPGLLLALGCQAAESQIKPEPKPGPKFVVSSKVTVAPIVPRVFIDSEMSRSEAIGTQRFPARVTAQMKVVTVDYVGFGGEWRSGQIVVHQDLASEVEDIFHEIRVARFPIRSIIPVARFGWNDDASVAANNTSGFNFRTKIGAGWRSKALSKHAFGRAIDINPFLNPYISRTGRATSPYRLNAPGTLTSGSVVVKAFKRRGWMWGGDWKGNKDYQHFEKP